MSIEISNTLKKLLQKRGLSSSDFEQLISWDLKKLPNFSILKDIEKAARRIVEAIEKKEQIGIYGDYDADGTCSCALLYHFFKILNIDVLLFQPGRFSEGYGLHIHSIDNAINANVNLLITVDCGITNNDAANYAKSKDNFTLIITDHHSDILEKLPNAYAVINPNRRDEKDEELKALTGVGVAFALCLEIKKHIEMPSIYPLLQFVAIGTIADLAVLNHVNLKLVRHGLKQMQTSSYYGISQFISNDERNITNQTMIPSSKISFEIAPMINSKGRLDHPERALKLLTAQNGNESFENYSYLEISNRERKTIQNEIFNEAKQQILKELNRDDMIVNIAYNPNWHEGVIGIVASKLVETFEVPAIVFTDSEDKNVIKASARTAGDLNLFECLNKCDDLFIKFGGHKAAAGISMLKENLGIFKEKISKIIAEHPLIERTTQSSYDIAIEMEDINLKFLRELQLLEPFGNYNPKPVFQMKNFKINSYNILKDKHVKWFISSKKNPDVKHQGISFNFIGQWNQLSPEELFKLQNEADLTAQFSLEINRFKNNEYIQLMIEKIF